MSGAVHGSSAQTQRICLNLLDDLSVLPKISERLFFQKKRVVPRAEGLLYALEAGGHPGRGFGVRSADLGEIAGSLAGLANRMKGIILFRIQPANSLEKPAQCHVRQGPAANCKIESGFQGYLQAVEFVRNLSPVFLQAFLQLASGLLPGFGKRYFEPTHLLVITVAILPILFE